MSLLTWELAEALNVIEDGAIVSGETEQQVSGWTVDTLHSHLRNLIIALDVRTDDRFIANEKAMTAAFEAQQLAMQTAFASSEKAVAAALAAAEKAVAAALAAQEKAVDTALNAANSAVDARQTAAEREFHEHLEQYRHEVDFAFQASDRAITKAEIATEKRFEAVNEFREQLREQAVTFISRTEALAVGARNAERIDEFSTVLQSLATRTEMEARTARNAERIEELASAHSDFVRRVEVEPARDQMNTRISELTTRLDRSEGRGTGFNSSWIIALSLIAALGTIISVYLAVKGG